MDAGTAAAVADTAFTAAMTAAELVTASASAAVETATASGALGTAVPTTGELLGTGLSIIKDWGTVGWMGSITAIALLLGRASKFPFIDGLFKRAPIWVRPLVIGLIGAVGGFFSALATGTPMLMSIIAGLGAGFAAVGGHQLLSRFTSGKQDEVAALRGLKETLAAGDDEIADKVDVLKEKLDGITEIKGEKERLAALAAWANGQR